MLLVDRIKNESLSSETFEDLIIEFQFEGTGDSGLSVLNTMLKSALGGVLDKANPSPEVISDALYRVRSVMKFIRALTLFNTEQFTLSNPKFRGILGLTSDFNSFDMEDDVMSVLEYWCYDDCGVGRCMDYALRLTRNFDILFTLINEANEAALKLRNKQKGTRNENA